MIKYRHLENRVAVLCFLNSYISLTKINIFTGLITSILRKIKHWHVNPLKKIIKLFVSTHKKKKNASNVHGKPQHLMTHSKNFCASLLTHSLFVFSVFYSDTMDMSLNKPWEIVKDREACCPWGWKSWTQLSNWTKTMNNNRFKCKNKNDLKIYSHWHPLVPGFIFWQQKPLVMILL